MDAAVLLADLKQEGLTVSTQGDRLIVESMMGITLSQKAWLIQHKPELLKLLASQPQEPASETLTLPDTTAQADTQALPADAEPSLMAGLVVEVFTPLGDRLTVKVDSPTHAEWLRRMNPKP